MPRSSFSFEVIKDGVVQGTVDLSSRAHFILGRLPGAADIVLEHPSVSRQHAVVQHRDNGEIYLMDLGSTHGTFMNKKRLDPQAYVPLRIGSSIKLGLSSRSLCLMGSEDPPAPTAEAQPAMEVQQQRAQARAEKISKRTGKSMVRAEDLHAAGGAGWGFSADAYELKEAEEDDPLESLSFEVLTEQAKAKGFNMTARQSRLVEQLEKRVEKLDNLSSENDKISAKEIEGLSEGQRAQMTRNEDRIKELQEQVRTSGEQRIASTCAPHHPYLCATSPLLSRHALPLLPHHVPPPRLQHAPPLRTPAHTPAHPWQPTLTPDATTPPHFHLHLHLHLHCCLHQTPASILPLPPASLPP